MRWDGAPGWNRTSDPWLRRPILYPLSYEREGAHSSLISTDFYRLLPPPRMRLLCCCFESPDMPSSQDASTTPSTLRTWALVGLALLISGSGIWVLTPPSPSPSTSHQVEAVNSPASAALVQAPVVPTPTRSGADVFKTRCAACHATGVLGAPKWGDHAAWAPRIPTGLDALTQSAIKGKNAMPAQGGRDLSDAEIRSGVIYMANAGGAHF